MDLQPTFTEPSLNVRVICNSVWKSYIWKERQGSSGWRQTWRWTVESLTTDRPANVFHLVWKVSIFPIFSKLTLCAFVCQSIVCHFDLRVSLLTILKRTDHCSSRELWLFWSKFSSFVCSRSKWEYEDFGVPSENCCAVGLVAHVPIIPAGARIGLNTPDWLQELQAAFCVWSDGLFWLIYKYLSVVQLRY